MSANVVFWLAVVVAVLAFQDASAAPRDVDRAPTTRAKRYASPDDNDDAPWSTASSNRGLGWFFNSNNDRDNKDSEDADEVDSRTRNNRRQGSLIGNLITTIGSTVSNAVRGVSSALATKWNSKVSAARGFVSSVFNTGRSALRHGLDAGLAHPRFVVDAVESVVPQTKKST